ncbi:U3 small nucleolar RNA-associated protein 14 homolog A [Austrofundulus limnaeus]|uniref:U3 small nucleolar RNA-associated protein 14 homolog A n=1 Tax=Austrofundulus limnaeus TaxID=52670 RepID=A0A2I4CUG2_AUSLI|nr:PREDICTED: U3 small nucleolar RNA-associated protein 14 homolog A-like [Austrofundulus limnaeus]
MVKVSKKKGSKRRSKHGSDEPEVSSVEPPVVYDDDDDDEDADLNAAGDEDLSSEEEENERKHQKLLEAISALGGEKKQLGERSEAATCMSEFTMRAEGEADKVQLSDLIGTTPAVSTHVRKQLKDLERSKKTVECPVSKQETQRIQRDLAFQKAASEVSRWRSIITQNQRAEQLVFPLNPEPSGRRPMERVVMGWKAQTPLEQEVFALLSANKQPINDPVLTPAEEASLKAMSLEEAKARRAELQKARALQSYYESKTRRERKIKSKKYHRVQNKSKQKDLLKSFEEMVKVDPQGALEELKKLELSRMQERMSLKHQNRGKWAKSRAIMAKYDLEARRSMQQQLEVNKELTQKLVAPLESEEEERAEDADMLPDCVNVTELQRDFSNPWMRGQLSQESTERKISSTESVTVEAAEEEEEEEEEPKEEELLRELDSRRKQRQTEESNTVILIDDEEEEEEDVTKKQTPEKQAEAPDEEEEVMKDQTLEEEAVSSDEEEAGLSEFTRIFRGLTGGLTAGDADIRGPSAQLEEGLIRFRSVEDTEDLPQEELVAPPPAPPSEPALSSECQVVPSRKRKKGIELTEVLTKDTTAVRVPLAPTITDSEDQLDQRGLIKEAFAGDDVISDFIREKRKQEEAGKPKAVDLTLPGWGEWGGLGLRPSKRKRRRFRTKAAPAPPRADRHLPSVIISEKRNSSVSLHQVSSLPFPFENHAQFESCIRAPLGRTWNTERTVKKVTKPRVLTRLGTIIEPMDQEELLKDQKKSCSVGSKKTQK